MKNPAMGETVPSISDNPALTPTLPADDGFGAEDPLPEVTPDRYEVRGELGRGGIGRVMEAHDAVLGRTIAIKELQDPDPGTRRRFVREVLITARLQHPSIVPVYEAGRRGGQPFYAMKRVAGRTLGDAIARADTLAARLALVPNVLAVADAIAYAHGERIVHRDLKPQNVLLGDFGETVVIDWGLAKDLAIDDREAADAGPYRHRSAHETVAGTVLGTPAYMAPEQAAGKDIDERADVYAIGAMLYHAVTGTPPHEGDSVDDMIANIGRGTITPLATRAPSAPADLATIVGKAMARDPAARYPTARELADDLRRFQTGQLVGAHRYTAGERAWRWLRRYRAVVAMAAAALVVLVGYGAWSIAKIVSEREQTAINNNRVIMVHARSALEQDPASALAWLAQLDPRGEGWEQARALASEAWMRPRPSWIYPGGPRDAWLSVDARGRILQTRVRGLRIIDQTTGDSWSFPIPTDGNHPVACDDGHRFLSYIDGVLFTMTVPAGTLVPASASASEGAQARARCTAQIGFFRDGGNAFAWDRDAGVARAIGERSFFGWIRTTADREHAISVHYDGTVIRWNRDGMLGSTEGLGGRDDRIGWSADGRLFATGYARAYKPTIFDFDTRTKVEVDMVADLVAVAPDASWVAFAGDDEVRLYSDKGKFRHRLTGIPKPTRLRASDDSRWAFAFDHRRVVVWEIAAPHPRILQSESRISDAVFADSAIFTTHDDGSVRRWPLEPLPDALPGPVRVAGYSPDGTVRVIAKWGELVRFRNGTSSRIRPPGALEPLRLAVGPTGEVVLARPDGVWRWKLDDSVERLPYSGKARVPDGIHVAWAGGEPISWNGTDLTVWAATPYTIAIDDYVPGKVADHALAVSPDGRWVAASTPIQDRNLLRRNLLFDLRERRVHDLVDSRGDLAAFSPDGRSVATGDITGAVVLWDVATRERRVVARADTRAAIAAYSSDGRRVAVVGHGELVIANATGDPADAVRFEFPSNMLIRAARWSPDDATFVVAAIDERKQDGMVPSHESTPDRIHIFDLRSRETWTRSLETISLDTADGAVLVTTPFRIVRLDEVLPRDRDDFIDWLAASPYRIDADNRLTTQRAP